MRRHSSASFGLLLALVTSNQAVTVSPEELAEGGRWVNARFDGVPPPATEPALVVLASFQPVQKNGRGDQPLRLGDATYDHGLHCPAFSQILVRLPAPGASFQAIVGVDSNDQTRGGLGSVQFSVRVGNREQFRSGVMREGLPGLPVKVDLGGAREFILQADETPDDVAHDHADWAEARVTLQNGRELWLADLPLRELESPPPSTGPPFSFVYDKKASPQLLKTWTLTRRSQELDAHRTERTLIWDEPRGGLQVRCVAIEYHDFPTVEWTLHFRNTGTNDTPLLENIQALDLDLSRGNGGEFRLRHNVGSPANGNDYAPLETLLKPRDTRRLGASGGRPTQTDWSCFNLEWAREGWIVGIGWPGQWAAELTRDNARRLHVRAGQELTQFKLLPGEEIRSPLVVLQFWRGDWLRAQNLWRRWMLAHCLPRPGGQLPPPQLLATSSRQFEEMVKANETNQIFFLNRYRAEGIQLDYWWMDAGWYELHGGGWNQVGTWQVDSNRFPRGLRAVADHAHRHGLKTLLWFEPERVTAGTWLAQNRPEWVLGGTNGGLLDLGREEARRWLTDHVDGLLREQGIDLYRQDFNLDPLEFWRKHDAPDRQGITEIRHVLGYLDFWDELRRRHPKLLIDTCASGGRRNDLETLRRAVPLWRSDYAFESTGQQCMTYGLSLWLPYHGTGTVAARHVPYYGGGPLPVEPYAFWSNVSPSLLCCFDVREKNLDYAALRRLIRQWRLVSPNYFGDFWPLTPWTRDDTVWMAWQFDRPEAGEGLVQAFRRPHSPYESARFRLRGLESAARYLITDLEQPDRREEYRGAELTGPGLRVTATNQPAAVVLIYKKVNP